MLSRLTVTDVQEGAQLSGWMKYGVLLKIAIYLSAAMMDGEMLIVVITILLLLLAMDQVHHQNFRYYNIFGFYR